MARKKKRIILENVKFTGVADRGKAVGRDSEGRVVFSVGPVPGDVADVLVIKKRKSYMDARPLEYKQLSKERVEPFCTHYDFCGGCKWQHLDYGAQVKYKEQVVRDAVNRLAGMDAEEFLPILAGERTRYYRNKLEFSFSNKRWLSSEEIKNPEICNKEEVLGFHASGSFDKIIDINECFLQPEPSNAIRNFVKEKTRELGFKYFDIRENSGFMRLLTMRITDLGEIMLIFSFYQDDQQKISALLNAVKEEFPQITSLLYCINAKRNDTFLDLPIRNWAGQDYIEEQLGHVRFKIGPKSFFQTNTQQGKVLYDTVLEFADMQGDENVYDLYTGIGSIALYMAHQCKQVVGIEEVAAAIDDAKENAELNGIENTVFYAGDVKDILTDDFAQKHGKPDLLVTDPPRAGMHPKVVDMLLQLEAPKMVYVSCNPATQARDLKLLKEKYDLVKIRPVDMFPHTHHIESVALLSLKK